MRVRLFQADQICSRQQMEDEPVVTLAQNLHGDTSRLLGNQHLSEIIFPSFFHPGDVRLRSARVLTEDGLRLLNNGDGRDSLGISTRELLLIAIKDAAKDKARQH